MLSPDGVKLCGEGRPTDGSIHGLDCGVMPLGCGESGLPVRSGVDGVDGKGVVAVGADQVERTLQYSAKVVSVCHVDGDGFGVVRA
jgi:hypothetical protein